MSNKKPKIKSMNHQNIANLTAQYQQTYLVYCHKIMQYLSLLAWMEQQQRPPEPKVKPKSASGVKKLAQEVNQEKPTLKSLKHLEKPNVSTIVAMGFPNGAMSAAFRVAFNELATNLKTSILSTKGESQVDFEKRAGQIIHNKSQSMGVEVCALLCDDGSGGFGFSLTNDNASANCSIYNLCPAGMSASLDSNGIMTGIHSHLINPTPTAQDLINRPNMAKRGAGSRIKPRIKQDPFTFSSDFDLGATQGTRGRNSRPGINLLLATPTGLLLLPQGSNNIKNAQDLGVY